MLALAADGSAVTLALGARLTLSDGEVLYLTGLGAYARGGRARLIRPVRVAYAPFTGLNATSRAPEYGPAKTLLAQLKADTEEKHRLVNPDDGLRQPETVQIAYLRPSGATDYPLIRAVFSDAARGQMVPDAYTVSLIPYTTTGGSAALGKPAQVSLGTPRPLTWLKVELMDQVTIAGGEQRRTGDAVIRFPRHEATQAELLGNCFVDITPRGESAQRYRVRNADGIKPDQTWHWCVSLERVRP